MQKRLLVAAVLLPVFPLLAQGSFTEQYIVDDVHIETRDGTPIAAIVVRKVAPAIPEPTALMYSIYQTDGDAEIARDAARRGYAAVIAYTRGVKTGVTNIVPYERDGEDAYDVIDWISEQSWSDGQVGMYGGSYSGFVQWAVAKLRHPALKTIVPQVPVSPGLGEPFDHGNVLVTQLAYVWPLTNVHHKRLPTTFFNDWYRSGVAYRDLDSIAGLENPTFNRWIKHPDFDEFWREIITDGDEFREIDIPVLTTTGYYDDAQLGALYYFREHFRYNADAKHYLAIGPYDHFGGQARPARELRGYSIDPSADYAMRDLAFQWLDYVLKGAGKPAVIAGQVNYQVMGANVWKHASSIDAMSNGRMRLYLDAERRLLVQERPDADSYLKQTVDLADRDTHNNVFTPRIVNTDLLADNALVFVSEPMQEALEMSGTVTGEFAIMTNKRDVDITYALYEQLPDGPYFFLSRYLGRASYANDRSTRRLLNPGEKVVIPFNQTKLTSRRLSEGSRLVFVLSVNKHPFEQINYGTGKDVVDESIADAGSPLEVLWHSDSFIEVPLWRD